jgi:glycosyltransferase involved in cell wall biosynthesis
MKIAIFHNLPSGGAKRALYGNVNYLTEEHNVDVFVPSTANEDYLPLKDITNNIKTFSVKNTVPNFLLSSIIYFPAKMSLINLEKVQRDIANDINRRDYDVVLCEQDRFTMAPFFLKYIKKPCVYFCQQPSIFRYDISRELYKKAGLEYKNIFHGLYLKLYGTKMVNHDKKYASYSKYMIANSNFSRELILKNYGLNSLVSYLGVDRSLFKPMNLSKDNFVLSVGQCIPEKGYEFILKSLAKIDIHKRPEFVIVTDQGNIHWKNYLQHLAVKLKVKLNVLTLINDDELIKLYNKAILVVYAPYSEPFGLVPLEAMSCGTPVVAVRDGGVKESVINNKTGILTDRDEITFSKEIIGLILDNEKREQMAEESINTVDKSWTLKNSGERILNHLIHAIDTYEE